MIVRSRAEEGDLSTRIFEAATFSPYGDATLATELEQLVASDQPLEEIIARWRGLRRDADVLRAEAGRGLPRGPDLP